MEPSVRSAPGAGAMISRVRAYVGRGDSLRPDAVMRAAARVAVREGRWWLRRRTDAARQTYASRAPGALATLLPAARLVEAMPGAALDACERYLQHRFDLLGSGWVHVRHGMECRGLEGIRFDSGPAVRADGNGEWLGDRVTRANLGEAKRSWSLVDAEYQPLDWQLDFKSGHRWDERAWYGDVRYGDRRGADVKVPWELGRCQHLPQLAVAFQATGDDRWVREIRNVILDFVAANPPRFGVQWCSTMDVAIRIANWLVAVDLCRAAGARLDDAFLRVLARTTWEHARHIASNLEWFPTHRGNHYLADVTGLLFAAAYLPPSAESDAWLALAVQEVVSEVEYQFGADGSNFEASTCYHRLSAEMVLYAHALVAGLPGDRLAALDRYDASLVRGMPGLRAAPLPRHRLADGSESPFPAWIAERLERMGEFTWRVTKPSGAVVQIGDNDSGRFLKPVPTFDSAQGSTHSSTSPSAGREVETEEPREDHLDHRSFVGAVGALLGREDLVAVAGPATADARLVSALAHGRVLPSARAGSGRTAADGVRVSDARDLEARLAELAASPNVDVVSQTLRFPGASLRDSLVASAYPDFGLYILRSRRLFLAVRCGSIGQAGYGGHAHNDQLAIELTVDGDDLLADPGSYIYTPLPDRRNAYRSVLAHAAPRIAGSEPGRIGSALFIMRDDPRATCTFFGAEGFLGHHDGYGARLHRHVDVGDEEIVVTDYLVGGAGEQRLDRSARLDVGQRHVPFSPGYGLVRT